MTLVVTSSFSCSFGKRIDPRDLNDGTVNSLTVDQKLLQAWAWKGRFVPVSFKTRSCTIVSVSVEYGLRGGWRITEHSDVLRKLQICDIDLWAKLDAGRVRHRFARCPIDGIME